MKRKPILSLLIIMVAVLFWAASAGAQRNQEGFDPSEDFRKSYPNELKKKDTWKSNKSRGSGAFGQSLSQGHKPAEKNASPPPPPEPEPQPTETETQWQEPLRDETAVQEESYPPPRQAAPRPQPGYQEDPADYMPPPGYYDQPSGAARQSGSKPPAGNIDNSGLDDYRRNQPPPQTYEEPQPAASAPPARASQPALGQPDTSMVESHIAPPPAQASPAPALEPADTSAESRPAGPQPAPVQVTAPRAAQRVSAEAPTDYSSADSWMYLPQNPDREVDVFFLYTGSCERPGVCSISDPGMRQKAMETTLQQAGVFEPVGNLFVPYYRQLNSGIFLGLKPADRAGRLLVSSSDAAAAFDYYIRNHNQGRPFILAAHGQGSAALLEGILSRYLENNLAARKQMVAAYAIGYSVTTNYLSSNPHLRIAERRNDVGVIISYSTEAPGVTSTNPAVLPGAVAINPVNWTRSERRALKENSKGSNLAAFGEDDYKEAFADARVNMGRGVVECSTAELDKYADPDYPHGAFPKGDYAFYYYDLRANAQERIDAFRQSRP